MPLFPADGRHAPPSFQHFDGRLGRGRSCGCCAPCCAAGFNGPRADLHLLLLVSALLVFTDWFNGYTGYSLDLVVPILCCVALVCNFIFAFLRSRFTANALVYLLMNIGIGVLPYILLFFRIDYSGRLDAHSLPWVICLIVSVITFLGLVIFRGRALKNEIVKRLHM